MNLLCTVCSGVLEPQDYEGTPVMQCNQCKGHLLDRLAVDDIKEGDEKSTAELMAEQDRDRVGDTLDAIRCPKCGGLMQKEFLAQPDNFHIDYCDPCNKLWFDGGELARLQLTYEAARRGRDRGKASGSWRSAPASKRAPERAAEKPTEQPTEQYEEADGGEEEGGIFGTFQAFINKLMGKGGRGYRRRTWMNSSDE